MAKIKQEEIPCHNCITLAICKPIGKFGPNRIIPESGVYTLAAKCSLIHNYIMEDHYTVEGGGVETMKYQSFNEKRTRTVCEYMTHGGLLPQDG